MPPSVASRTAVSSTEPPPSVSSLREAQTPWNASDCLLRHARRVPPTSFPQELNTVPSDGPLFSKEGLRLSGYFVLLPTTQKMSTVHDDLQKTFAFIQRVRDVAETDWPGESGYSRKRLQG